MKHVANGAAALLLTALVTTSPADAKTNSIMQGAVCGKGAQQEFVTTPSKGNEHYWDSLDGQGTRWITTIKSDEAKSALIWTLGANVAGVLNLEKQVEIAFGKLNVKDLKNVTLTFVFMPHPGLPERMVVTKNLTEFRPANSTNTRFRIRARELYNRADGNAQVQKVTTTLQGQGDLQVDQLSMEMQQGTLHLADINLVPGDCAALK